MASLSTAPSRSTPQWPWLVYSQQQTSVRSSRSGCRARIRRSARWTMPSSAKFSRADLVLGRRQAEQQHRRDAERPDPVHLAIERFVDRQVADAGHRADLALDPGTVDDEDRLDEVGGVELMLAHEPPEGVGAPPAPRTMDRGGGHGGKTRGADGHRRNRGRARALPHGSWWPGSRRAILVCITASTTASVRILYHHRAVRGATGRPPAVQARWSRLPMRTSALPALPGAGRPGGRRLWRAPRQAGSTSPCQPRDRHRRRHPVGRHRPRAGANAVTVVRGDRILCAGAAGECPVPQGANVIDAQGQYLIPGLIDSHVHLLFLHNGSAGEDLGLDLRDLLAQGITTVRDMGTARRPARPGAGLRGARRGSTRCSSSPGADSSSPAFARCRPTGGGDPPGPRAHMQWLGWTPIQFNRDDDPDAVVAAAREAGAMGLKLYAQLDSLSRSPPDRCGTPGRHDGVGACLARSRRTSASRPAPGWTAWCTPRG